MATFNLPLQETEEERRKREGSQTVLQDDTQPQVNIAPIVPPKQLEDLPEREPMEEINDSMSAEEKTRAASRNLVRRLNNAVQVQDARIRHANERANAATEQLTQQYNDSMAKARKTLSDYLNEGLGGYDAMLKVEQDREEEERNATQMELKGNVNAAKWTGLTELAASVANLFGTFHNAAPQTYKSVQQDWMQKAESEIKERRNRIDNMRERQRAIQQQILQLKMSNGQALAGYDRELAGAIYNSGINQVNSARDAEVASANLLGQGAQKAAEAEAQGVTAGIQAANQERQLNNAEAAQRADIAQGWTRLNETERSNKANEAINAAYRGLTRNEDGTYSQDPDSGGYSSNRTTSSDTRRTTGSSGNRIWAWANGEAIPIEMNAETYKQAKLNGKPFLKKDVERIIAEKSKRTPTNRAERIALENELEPYKDILDNLNGTGDPDEDNKAIEDFIQRHGEELDSFNESLLRLAGHRVQKSGGNTRPPREDPATQRDTTDPVALGNEMYEKIMNENGNGN